MMAFPCQNFTCTYTRSNPVIQTNIDNDIIVMKIHISYNYFQNKTQDDILTWSVMLF